MIKALAGSVLLSKGSVGILVGTGSSLILASQRSLQRDGLLEPELDLDPGMDPELASGYRISIYRYI